MHTVRICFVVVIFAVLTITTLAMDKVDQFIQALIQTSTSTAYAKLALPDLDMQDFEGMS